MIDDPFFAVVDNYKDLFKTTGYANTLKTPSYPSAAKRNGVRGKITVGITIDEQGNVISAEVKNKFNLFSVSGELRGGYLALWKAAEEAAMQSKFSPTFLVEGFIKVTGTIDYNFVP